MTAEVAPFPYGALETMTRREATAASRLRRAARAYVDAGAVASALAELCEERVDVVVRRLRRAEPRPADDAVGVMLSPVDEPSPERRVLVEAEGALAAALVTRALRQRAPRVLDASRSPSPHLAGATAGVVAAALRRAHGGRPLRVVAAGPAHALARDLLATASGATTVWLTVVVGADAFDARVTLPEMAALAPLDALRPDLRAALLGLGDAPLAMPVVAATTLALRAEIDALARGDAFVPAGLRVARHDDGSLRGAIALVAPSSEEGLAADLAEGGRLVVRGDLESHPLSHVADEEPMPADSSPTATIRVMEEVPVVVRVELGAVEMTARAWAELAPGDVVALGRKVGDPATLRVGGVEVARGELVVVDGEIAVRVIDRAGAGA